MRAENHSITPSVKLDAITIGVLSDTHGHIDPQVMDMLGKTDLILHAGDLDRPDVLKALGKVGNIVAVRGNMDYGPWSKELPQEQVVEAGDILVYMIHDLQKISLDPSSAGIHVVISGHTHHQAAFQKKGVLYLNPGSASFPRGGENASMALIEIEGDRLAYRHIGF